MYSDNTCRYINVCVETRLQPHHTTDAWPDIGRSTAQSQKHHVQPHLAAPDAVDAVYAVDAVDAVNKPSTSRQQAVMLRGAECPVMQVHIDSTDEVSMPKYASGSHSSTAI